MKRIIALALLAGALVTFQGSRVHATSPAQCSVSAQCAADAFCDPSNCPQPCADACPIPCAEPEAAAVASNTAE